MRTRASMHPCVLVVVAALVAFPASLALVSCTGNPIIDGVIGVGQTLLAAAAKNYAPDYKDDLALLIAALVQPPKPSTEATFVGMEDLEAEDEAGGEATTRGTESRLPIALEASLMKEVLIGDRYLPIPVEDGDALKDGGGVEGEGDNIKLCFRSNVECYIYVIGVDATGWVDVLYPDQGFDSGNPVTANREYLIPEGSYWYPLDLYRGVETVYFVASHERRQDLEEILTGFAERERPEFPADKEVAQVEETEVITRGWDKPRKGRSALVTMTAGNKEEFTPFQFSAEIANADLVVTKWFHHVGP